MSRLRQVHGATHEKGPPPGEPRGSALRRSYLQLPQKRWMRVQASSSAVSEVA